MNTKAKRRQKRKKKMDLSNQNEMDNLNEEIIDSSIPEVIIEQETIITPWIRLRDNQPLTCQKIEMTKELVTESKDQEQNQDN